MSTNLFKVFDDLGFGVEAELGSHWVDYKIYVIMGRDGDKIYWEGEDGTATSPVDSIPKASVFLHGYVKWDGCSNWLFDENARDCMIHACTRERLVHIGEVMARCWDWTSEILDTWDY